MTANDARRALTLLPPCPTTGIGSLPHTQLELAVQMAMQVDIPYLPQLPSGNPGELMIPSALEGLPGMSFDSDGLVTVDVSTWRAQSDQYGDAIELALQSGDVQRFEPSSQACRAWRPFLWEVENRKLPLAKVQIAGPATVRWVAKTSEGEPASKLAGLDRQIFRLLLARSVAMIQAVRRANAVPLFFLDEPGLYALDRRDATHLMVLQELKLLAVALRREGALVGLHCCGNTDWELVLGLGFDLISMDVRLSLDAVLEQQTAFRRFLASGSTLSLGIIPTNLAATFAVDELVDAVEVSLESTLPRGGRVADVLSRMLLTPACGLAMRTVQDAERTFEQLRAAQRALRQWVQPSAAHVGTEARAPS